MPQRYLMPQKEHKALKDELGQWVYLLPIPMNASPSEKSTTFCMFSRVILTFEVPAAVALLVKTYCPKLILTNIT